MNMKRMIVVIAAMLFSLGMNAQSLDDGIKMYHYERYQTARGILEPLAASNAQANYYVGLAQIGQGELEAAKATFNKYSTDPANISGLARVAFEQKKVAEGNKIAENVAGLAKKKDWEPLRYAADAITYTEGGNYQQAISWYKKALTVEPNNEWLLLGLGDAQRAWARVNHSGSGDAMTNYEKIVGFNPKNSLVYSRIGSLWYAATTYKLAQENYDKAIEADPENPIPYRELANAYQRQGNYEKAKEAIEKYRAKSDKNADVERQYLGLLYLSKDYKKAIDGARELLKSGAKNPGIHGILGASLYEVGDTTTVEEAAKEYGIYMQTRDPNKITAQDYITYGNILLRNKQTDSATRYFNVGLSKDTTADKSKLYRDIAEGFKAAKEYKTAAVWLSKVAAEGKATATDYFYYGYYNFVTEGIDTAAKAFEEMETKFPDQPVATLYRGRVAAAIDSNAKTGAAIPHYEKWLAIPDSDKYTKKKPDLMNAYQYLAFYYYNRNDKANMKKYLDEIEKLEPTNSFLKQLRDAEKTMK